MNPFSKPVVLFIDDGLGDELALRLRERDPIENPASVRGHEVDFTPLEKARHRLTRRRTHIKIQVDARQVTLIACLRVTACDERLDALMIKIEPGARGAFERRRRWGRRLVALGASADALFALCAWKRRIGAAPDRDGEESDGSSSHEASSLRRERARIKENVWEKPYTS